MQIISNHFANTALIITHYNRSKSLENLLTAFNNLNCIFQEIIVSDDSSNEFHLNQILELQNKFNFKLIT